MRKYIGTLLVAGLFAGTGASFAGGFDGHQPCDGGLQNADPSAKEILGAWALENGEAGLRVINDTCANTKPDIQLELVSASTEAPGSEAHARALLLQFFEPDADLVTLTTSIFPTAAEVHLVYNDPLASLMAETYAKQLKPGIKLGPKSDQTELLLTYTHTSNLQNGDAVLDEFPGGYKEITQYFKADVPIVRFKFVAPGETTGMAFDGLVFVNDHWVMMPKPWRSLK